MSKFLKNTLVLAISLCSSWMSLAQDSVDAGDLPTVIRPSEVPYGTIERDRRLCAYPMCGGYFLRPLNADPATRPIYVSNLDVADFGPEIEKLIESHLNGGTIVKGWIRRPTAPGIATTLKISEVYAHRKGSLWADPKKVTFIKASKHTPPIDCVTAPCPNLLGSVLNTRKVVSFDQFDTSALPLQVPEKLLHSPQMILGGAFADGTVEFPGGYELLFSVSSLYSQVTKKVELPTPALEVE
ncbi:MAG TPA: DUF6748 domain-containing protein [Oligoflexus sp.]|uniref:DUF6748 domain-containing protein n=1 Tax=Oligoflexus sp. TaxID=1971216 RepID=UPI002D41DA58|nr:DUF6748 domain-containing protein [Oligoflexus sp.]HYX35919.1 DUF6748 domain-containing protein [Oligoflexus sp.]